MTSRGSKDSVLKKLIDDRIETYKMELEHLKWGVKKTELISSVSKETFKAMDFTQSHTKPINISLDYLLEFIFGLIKVTTNLPDNRICLLISELFNKEYDANAFKHLNLSDIKEFKNIDFSKIEGDNLKKKLLIRKGLGFKDFVVDTFKGRRDIMSGIKDTIKLRYNLDIDEIEYVPNPYMVRTIYNGLYEELTNLDVK